MAKIGVGVGEEFPVNEPPPHPPDPDRDAVLEARRRYWRSRHYLHIATRVAIIALIAAFIVWLFLPHADVAPPNAANAYPYYRHFFFFPFFPLILILLFALAWRRRGGCYYGPCDWRDYPRGSDRGGEA